MSALSVDISRLSTDVVVIGSGGAGMRAAVEVSDLGAQVVLASKGALGFSGATVTASADVSVDSRSCVELLGLSGDLRDSKEAFMRDVVIGGKYLNRQRLVEVLVDEAPVRVKEILGWGAKAKHLYTTPGHSFPRGVWIDGREFAMTLAREVRRRPIKVLENFPVFGIATDGDGVTGVYGLDLASGSYVTVRAKAVVIATGGAMSVFPLTTSPNDLTGDGMVMAFRAGARLLDMEFPMYLVACCAPPAVAGLNYPFALLCRAGAHLYNREGDRFLEKWDPVRMERTTRDILTVATTLEILQGRGGPNGGVWVSLKHLPNNLVDYFHEWYGAWHGRGKTRYEGFDILGVFPNLDRDGIESRPAAHFWNGGIEIDEWANTCVPGLVAAGETTGGVHGANRLSGDAMTETLVYGTRAGHTAARFAKAACARPLVNEQETEFYAGLESFIEPEDDGGHEGPGQVAEMKRQLRQAAWELIGPVRSADGLDKACAVADSIKQQLQNVKCSYKGRVYNREWIDAIGAGTACDIMKLTAMAASARQESRGSHYRKDAPKSVTSWLKNVVLRKDADGQPSVELSPLQITGIVPEGYTGE